MDTKAKKILFKTYWSSRGWLEKPTVSKDDFEYAKLKGLMFDPLTISHDDCIHEILRLRDQISINQIYKAFLCSLSTRRLDLRSSIASYFLAKKMISHQYTPVVSGYSYDKGEVSNTSYTCLICKDTQYGIVGNQQYTNTDLNVLNFERIKWGGVRHGDILYTYFDLTRFIEEDIPDPTQDDCMILKNILDVIASSNSGDYPSVLEQRLKDVLPSNKDERQILIEILACIGILEPKLNNRPVRGKSDWVYVTFWRGEDKYNTDIVNQYFGAYLNKK